MIPTAFFKLLAISDSACLRQFAIVVKCFILAIFAISSMHFCKQLPLNLKKSAIHTTNNKHNTEINDISKKTAQRNYSPVKYCNLFYQSRALLKGNTLFVLKIFVLINPYKCLPVLKITIQDYPAKLHSLKAACTNENCLSKPMDKSSYWETFLTILILEEVKTGKQLPIQTCFKQTSQCSRF